MHTSKILLYAALSFAPFFASGCLRKSKVSESVAIPATTLLFNGQNLDGWTAFPATKEGAAPTWSVVDGTIRCTGHPAGYLKTNERYSNYRLFVDWRWDGPAPLNNEGRPVTRNNGVLLHMQGEDGIWPKSLEGQLMEGNAGDFYVIGGVETNEWRTIRDKALAAAGDDEKARKNALGNRRIVKAQSSSEKPAGEWNTYEILCQGDTVVLKVNGVEQNRTTGVTVQEGHICLQSEGAPITFRNVRIERL